MSTELAAAHAAVDDAVAILRDGRSRPHTRIDKAAKDFLTEVDLASESALQRALAASTPEIGFYGEEGGGAALEVGKVWVADPLDGTINYATGSPLCGVMLGLLEDGVPTLGVIDLPFLGVRVDSGAVADVDALDKGIIAMGDAFHRGGTALGRLPRTDHDPAPAGAPLPLRRRSVGALGLARQRPDPGHAAGTQQPVRRRRRPCDRARCGSDLHRLRGRPADPRIERSDGGGPRHSARARRPRR